LATFRAFARPSGTEKDAADALEATIRRAGGKGSSFPSIVAVGDRAALPHAPPTAKRLDEAPAVLVDWGASGAFYKSDLTRVLVSHNNSAFHRSDNGAKLRDVYGVVLRAQESAIAAVR